MQHVKKLPFILLLIPLLGSYVTHAQNLIPNGGFENNLNNWWTNAATGAEATFTIITSDPAEGSKALKADVIKPGTNAWDVQAVNDAWASVSGQDYTLTFWAKAATAGSSFKAIIQNTSYAEKTFSVTENWQKYEWTFNAAEEGLQLKFHFPSQGTFFIDGIVIPSPVNEEWEELVLNGGFEKGSGSSFDNWWFGAGSGSATFVAETAEVQAGSQSLKAVVEALGANPWDVQAVNDPLPTKAGENYSLTFWAKAATAGSTFKTVIQNTSYAEKSFTISDSWQQYQTDFTAQEADLQIKFQFTSTGTFYIDQVSIPVAAGSGEPEEGAALIAEAESGTIAAPSDPAVFAIITEGTTEFVRVQENFLQPASSPGDENRVISYSVTFPQAGTYDLYARIRVGAEGFNDDSFYYASGFGSGSVTDGDQWVTANSLNQAGFTQADAVVTGGGASGNGVWKWINLSEFTGGDPPVSFTVEEGNLTRTFRIGSRENGLDIDKFAFGLSDVYYTVDNLNKGEAGTLTPPSTPYTPTGDPIAQGQEKFLGNVYSSSQLPYFENYWNQVTPENSGKWGSVESTRDVMNWTELDAAYNYAKENGFPFRFHVLIWGNQQPSWINDLPAAEQLEEIKEWFAAVSERYPDLEYIEVVNEPVNDPPGQNDNGGGNYINALGGTGTTGWDWIITSFRLAREYFPEAQLMINEYSIINDTQRAETYVEIVNLLQAESLIDVIGFQGHAFSTRVPVSVMAANLELLASTGLPIMVTELDIDGPDPQQQLSDYQRIFPLFWEHPSVIGVTLWGWKPGMWRTAQGAYLAETNGAQRPALVWLREYVNNNRPVVTLAQTFSVSEGAPEGAVVGTVTATDSDAGNTLSGWQIEGGSGEAVFNIDAVTGAINVAAPSLLDYETTTTYTLQLSVSDGLQRSETETITINVSNENDNAPVVAANLSFGIDQGICNVLGVVTATDADDTNQPDYTLLQNWQIVGGTGASAFGINPETGEISLTNTSMVDFSVREYTLLVAVSDGGNTSAEETVTITIPERLNVCIKGKTNIRIPWQAASAVLKKDNCLGACGEQENKPKPPVFAGLDKWKEFFEAYPNPVKDQLFISLGTNELNIHTIEIQDILTAKVLVKVQVNGASDLRIPRGQLRKGIYVLKAKGEQEIMQRIIIE